MDLEEQVEKLTKETLAFRKEMLIMKALLKQQNNLLKDLIEMNEKALKTPQFNTNYTTIGNLDISFPIPNVDDLDYLENSIDSSNKDMIIEQVMRIVGNSTLSKKIDQILSMDLILEFNVDGHQNKRRLLNYPNFMDILFKATMKTDWTDETFRDELRCSIKRSKNRYFKQTCLQRKKMKMDMENENE